MYNPVNLFQGPAQKTIPCDVLIPQEIPHKVKGLPGEIEYVSVKDKLLEAGVALRK